MIISFVSLPVIVSICGVPVELTYCPVARQEPCGIGEVANIGLTTVVAPGGACPVEIEYVVTPLTVYEVSNPIIHYSIHIIKIIQND